MVANDVQFGIELVNPDLGASVMLDIKFDKDGSPAGIKNSLSNLRKILEYDPRIAGALCYNEVAYRRWVRTEDLPWADEAVDRTWNDADESHLRLWFEEAYGLSVKKEHLADVVAIAAGKKSINPIKEFLDGLKWDGTPRIDTALTDYLGAEKSDYTASVMRLFMFGAIARVYEPGVKFDYCMILAGPQGLGKSTFFARLAVKPQWFNDSLKTLNADNAKIAEQLSGRWILELGELAAIKRADDVEAVKQFITAQRDVYRTPYNKYEEERPRCCVFGGTTNSLSFLVDKSGSRRFPVVTTGARKPTKSLFAKDCENEFKQMWAEALHYWKNGKGYLVLTEEMETEAETIRSLYQEEDARVGIIQEWLDNTREERVCVPMIHTEALEDYGKPTKRISNELHEIMRRQISGWVLHSNKNGLARCGKYGKQVCYVRDGTDKLAPPATEPVELL